MMALTNLLAPEILRPLALSLLHFLWQGAALAALSAAAFAVARSAATRYVIGWIALLLLLASPVLTFMLLRNSAAVAPLPMAFPTHAYPATSASHQPQATSPIRGGNGPVLKVLVEIWFVGVLLFSLRTAGGLFLIARLRRRAAHPIRMELLKICREMQDRLGIAQVVRYCESLHLDSPVVIGWFRPVVLFPMSALTGLNELQLRAVIAHELAHIRRLDAFFNLFQVASETLLFYHPAVWWLNKRIRLERENCCDDVALAACGSPAEYARALAQMEEWRVAPSLAMAANRGPLTSRVARLLGLPEQGSNFRNAGIAFSLLCLAAVLVTGTTLFGLIHTASARGLRSLPHLPAIQASPEGIAIRPARLAPQANPSPDPSLSREQKSGADPTPTPKAQSYIESLKAEGFDNLSADELIALKVQGITPEYIHQIHAEGLQPSADELIGMKVQGITPEYIHQVREMKLHLDIDALIGMKVQGITPEYVEQMRKLGFQASSDELIGMKVQGITPQYVQELNELNIHGDPDDLIGMKVQGIDANYIRSIRSAGLNPDKDEWIALKVQGVTAQFIKSLEDAGFKADVDDVVAAKVMGITPQFIALARSHGFKDLDLEKLIELKNINVLE